MWLTELGRIEDTVLYVFCAVIALNIILTVVLFLFSCICSLQGNPGSSMDFYIGLGGLGLLSTVIIKGLVVDDINLESVTILCQIYPCILTISATFFIGGMLLKACAIFNYYKGNKSKRHISEEWKPNFWMVLLALIAAMTVFGWVMAHYMVLIQAPEITNTTALFTDDSDSYFLCRGDHDDKWQMALSLYHAILLLIAGIMTWFAVCYAQNESSAADANLLSVAIYNAIFVVVAGILLVYLFPNVIADPTIRYAIIGGLTLWTVFFTLLMLLISRILHARKERLYDDSHYASVDESNGIDNEGQLDFAY